MTSCTERKLKDWPWFILLLPLVFPLFLYANNLGEVTLISLWWPLLFSLLLGCIIFGIVYLLKRDIVKASLITLILDFFVFSYGHIYTLLKSVTVFGVLIGRHRFLTPVVLLIGAILIWRVIRIDGNPQNAVKVFNLLMVILFIFQSILISVYEVKSTIVNAQVPDVVLDDVYQESDESLRDIYLIVLDAYSRSDWLNEWSGYDDSEFLSELEDLGFYVVPCSRSNYSYTIQSMTSELNMNYLQNLDILYNDVDMSYALKNSDVRNTFSDMGYEFIFFETGYPWIEMKDADRYIEAEENITGLDDYEILYLKTTSLIIPYDAYSVITGNLVDLSTKRYVARVRSVFEHLQQSISEGKPIFVYAHIVSPHSPPVFSSNGSINYDWETDGVEAYRETYHYLDREVLKTISMILEYSSQEPIIILQSDHGNGDYGYANLNLNAYYLPDGGDESLYPTITPVNTFRVVFNQYFGYELPFLEDLSYYSLENDRYNFELVNDPYDYCQELNKEKTE